MTGSFITLEGVLRRTPFSKTEWYRGMQEGVFPASYARRPDKPESRGVCWKESDIDEVLRWIETGGSHIPCFRSDEAIQKDVEASSRS